MTEAAMLIDFPYRGYETFAPAEVSDGYFMGVFSPGAPPLDEAVGRGRHVPFLIDDGSRGGGRA
jgi:hypothetical protein